MQNSMKQSTEIVSTPSISLWTLFLTFFKIGAFTFGGGYAMIAIVENEVVSRRNWITSAEMLDMLIIAESTPGVIAVNTATSVGYKMRGVKGAIVSTLGVVLPSFVIIIALSFAIEALRDNVWYNAAFAGIQACVMVLIFNAFIKLFCQLHRSVVEYIIFVVAFAVALLTDFNVIFIIMIGAAVGIVVRLIADKRQLPVDIAKGDE